jgi:hypothetical protein
MGNETSFMMDETLYMMLQSWVGAEQLAAKRNDEILRFLKYHSRRWVSSKKRTTPFYSFSYWLVDVKYN